MITASCSRYCSNDFKSVIDKHYSSHIKTTTQRLSEEYGFNADIEISPNRWLEDENRDEKPPFSGYCKTSEVNYVRSEEWHPSLVIIEITTKLQQQKNCKHTFSRPKINDEGDVDPTGIGECSQCGFIEENALPPQPARTVKSSYKDVGYISKVEWPEDAFLQCGDSGVVIGGENPYTTAFFEAFPNVHGYGTFIRGEGKTIREAEKNAWGSYQRKLSCKKHEFSRTVNGTHRTDGCGTCIHCNLFSSEALEPETMCHKCAAPTKHKMFGLFECKSHYFDRTLEEYIDLRIRERDSEKSEDERHYSYLSTKTDNTIKFEETTRYKMRRAAFEYLTEEEFTLKIKRINQCIVQFENYMVHKLTGKNKLLGKNCPSLNDIQTMEMIETLEKNFTRVIDDLFDKEKQIKFANYFD